MTKHLALALAALALAAAPAAAQRVTRSAPRGAPDHDPAQPVHDDLLVFWTQQYGFRSDPEPGSEQQEQGAQNPFTFELLAKAPKDECFIAIGQHTVALPPACPPGSIEKANELYLWGMALEHELSGDESIWFGISANTPCLANGSLGGLVEPSQDSVLVCEYNQSRLVQQIPVWPAGLGDYRPPRLLRLDVDEMTLAATLHDLTPQLDFVSDFQLQTTIGIRAVGIHDGVVLFAGPALTITGAVNFFAFTTEGTFLGSTGTDQYANVRRFVNAGGDLYVGMLNSLTNLFPGGTVLRWAGSVTNPFAFEVVGRFDNEVGELAVYTDDSQGPSVERLVAGTWPRLYGPYDQTDALYGLFESPPLPLDAGDAFGWSELWRINDYEPDPVTARAIASGGIAFHDGYLWFGTLITIGIPVLAWIEQYGIPFTQQQVMQVVLGTYRPLTFFRGRKVGGSFQVDVLYGQTELPVYQPFGFPPSFVPMPTLDGPPLSGLGGFDNFYNTYTWSVQVGSDDLLYVGTLDNSFTLFGVEMLANQPEAAVELIAERDWGADLWVFGSGPPEARPVMTRGFGNDANSGIRNLVSGETGLYAGTGNVSNITPEGGWELVRVLSPLMGQD